MNVSKRWGDDEYARARGLAQRYLRYGVRSTEELRAHLRDRGVGQRIIEPVLVVCTQRGLLDDRACARLWAVRLADRGYAAAAIRERLLAKGLNVTQLPSISASLQTASDADRAQLLVRDRLRRGARRDPRLRHRLARLLAQRGFDPDLIDQILNESLGSPSDL